MSSGWSVGNEVSVWFASCKLSMRFAKNFYLVLTAPSGKNCSKIANVPLLFDSEYTFIVVWRGVWSASNRKVTASYSPRESVSVNWLYPTRYFDDNLRYLWMIIAWILHSIHWWTIDRCSEMQLSHFQAISKVVIKNWKIVYLVCNINVVCWTRFIYFNL